MHERSAESRGRRRVAQYNSPSHGILIGAFIPSLASLQLLQPSKHYYYYYYTTSIGILMSSNMANAVPLFVSSAALTPL